MAEKFLLPKMTASMKEGTILEWLKKEGDRIVQGEPIVQVETDKAVQELEAPISGVLVRILQRKGKVPVDTVLALIEPE
jgi:pyruvate/2-oxoglutarate dehydrogenase complex dihydrolipoamide acyltransferase (E2) component